MASGTAGWANVGLCSASSYYYPSRCMVGGSKRCHDPFICLSHDTAVWSIGTMAACSLATAGHQRCADCGPVCRRTLIRRDFCHRRTAIGGDIPRVIPHLLCAKSDCEATALGQRLLSTSDLLALFVFRDVPAARPESC